LEFGERSAFLYFQFESLYQTVYMMLHLLISSTFYTKQFYSMHTLTHYS